MPWEWLISRIAEEFHCTPSVAEREWERDPVLVGRILEMRGFVAAKQHIDQSKTWDDLKVTPNVALYMQIEYALMTEDFGVKG
jgi:hypothetical protein